MLASPGLLISDIPPSESRPRAHGHSAVTPLPAAAAKQAKIIRDFVTHHGISRENATAWANDLRERAQLDEYFFSLNRYLFTARKPSAS